MNQPSKARTPAQPMFLIGIVGLVLLFLFSVYLAANRIFQVDEAQQVYQSAILARGQSALFYTHAPLHHLGPMAWISRTFHRSVDVFFWNRMMYLAVFWINIAILAWLPERKFRSRRYLGWLLAAATIAPLWDYGFEIRHDNLALTGILLIWALGRIQPAPSLRAFAGIGALCVVLQFVAFKTFLYWIPLSFAFLAIPDPDGSRSAWPRRRAWLLGFLAALTLVGLCYWTAGALQAFQHGFKVALTWSRSVERFSPLSALARMASESPIISALALGFLAATTARLRAGGRATWSWTGQLPEWALLSLALLAFLANPTPFMYNLLFLSPFAFLGAAQVILRYEESLRQTAYTTWLIGSIVGVIHVYPFLSATLRHLDFPNDRQVRLMNLAEELTNPATDPVFDGVGLVPTRSSIGYNWWLHTFTIQQFQNGTFTPVRKMLSERPAPVVLLNYRTNWLPKEDHQYFADHYFSLADDILVLGRNLPIGGGAWKCLKEGWYVVRSAGKGPIPITVEVNGTPVSMGTPLHFSQGEHQLRSQGPAAISVAWVGPHRANLPPLPRGDHRTLFINWY